MHSILVTGGAGFLGSHLCDRLIAQGDEVICLDNFFTGRKQNIEHLLDHPRFELVRHDIVHPMYLEVDRIYNLACPASPEAYQYNPIKTIKTSTVGMVNVLGIAKRCRARLLHASTSEVYGDPDVHPQTEDYWGHVNPIGPRSCYDEGKRVAESLCVNYHLAHGVEVRIIRIFNTYGPRMDPHDGRVISNFITQALRGDPLTIYGEGGQTRSFCYVDDLLDGMIRFMNQDDDIGPMNCGNPTEYSMLELAKMVLKVTGSKSRLEHLELPADDPKQRCPNIAKAKKLLGWSPKVDLKTGLERTVAYYRETAFAEQCVSNVLVTGAAGFIGYHLCRGLLERGVRVTGLDNLSEYYDVRLKRDRLASLGNPGGFTFYQLDCADADATSRLFEEGEFETVVHLAAQAGVRYSISHPHEYVRSNVVGFFNVLEGCRNSKVGHLVFASSSSVYGANTKMPFSVHDASDHPMSLYAATKKADEQMAHAYSHLYGLPVTGLRFFTVYGPWGRPDMALFKFTRAILDGTPIDVYNRGDMRRDFTYIDDVVEGVIRVADRVPAPNPGWSSGRPDPATSSAPFRLYNIGNSQPVELSRVIELLEQSLGKPAVKNLLPMQPGDVPATFADVDDLARDVGFRPATPIEEGIEQFVSWFRKYYGV